MKSKDIDALISYRMERSIESIRAAEIMLENGMLIISMNRVYYSMFYAVQTLLALHKVSFSKHGQVTLLAVQEIHSDKHLVVVYREIENDGFIITAFITSKTKSLDQRNQLWPK